MLAEFFKTNLDVVFMIYGLSFIIMGVAILIQPRRESIFKLSGVIGILGGFGIIHGVNEWLDMFSLFEIRNHLHNSYAFSIVRAIILTSSYIFLFEFGSKLVRLRFKNVLSRGFRFVLYAASFTLIFVFTQPGILPRYLLGFPAALISALGFIWYYKDNQPLLRLVDVRRYFFIAGIILAVYGVLGGIIVPKGDFFPASIMNTETFLKISGVPVQAFRAVCAGILAWAVWHILGIFNWEVRRRLKTSLDEVNLAKNKLDNMIKSMVDILIIIGPDKEIRKVNPAALELLGYTEEELVGSPVTEVFAQADPLLGGVRFDKLIKDGFVKNYETHCKTKTSNHIPVLFSCSVIRNDLGKLEGIVGIAKDISEYKKAEEELKSAYNQLRLAQSQLIQVEKMETVGRLAGGVAHEVKNPLAVILQGIDYLSQKVPKDNEEIALTISYINDAVKRANGIVMGLLDFSSISEMNTKPEKLDIIIESSLLLLKNYLDQKHIEVIRDYDTPIPFVSIDRNRIEQVFVNLILNAIQAVGDCGQIKIKTDVEELSGKAKQVIVRFEDNGQGIPENLIPKIFDPFFTTKRAKGGTGLGLSVVKNILDMHDSSIEIENRKDNPGVRATVRFKVQL